jgi:type I restriction enzyme S subunit
MLTITNIGLDQRVISKINDIFRLFPEIDEAILYGSRAMGNFKPHSDIDLTLKGENLDLSILQKIETQLDDLLLPYKIDLSIFHQIQNQDLVEHISRVGKKFY